MARRQADTLFWTGLRRSYRRNVTVARRTPPRPSRTASSIKRVRPARAVTLSRIYDGISNYSDARHGHSDGDIRESNGPI